MLALSPPLFSTIGWSLELEEATNHNQNDLYKLDAQTSDYLFSHQFTSSPKRPQPQVELERSTPSPAATMVKKLNHNASERDRRKKINSLYSSLRSLLPKADQMKKLSIPATISQVLKYISELQQEVEGVTKKKEEILLRISRQGDVMVTKESRRKIGLDSSSFAVSTTRLNDCEAVIQISSNTAYKITLSEVLLCLEKDGSLLLNASSFETSGRRVFYNLHFQVEESYKLDSDMLTEKLMSIYEKKEGIF